MNADLLAVGRSLRELGRTLSWSDLRDVVGHRRYDSALSRSLDPDGWFWNDPVTILSAKSATILSSMRFWNLMGLRLFDEIPEEYLPVEYGPKSDDAEDQAAEGDAADAVSADERARAVAAEILG